MSRKNGAIWERERAERLKRDSEQREWMNMLPAGWTLEAYRLYMEDPDGGRAVCRMKPMESMPPTYIEMLSREA